MYNLILKYFSVLIIFSITAVSAFAGTDNRKFTLVIDAGHGGKDSGAIGHFSKEKNINLKVALAFGRLVEAYCPDVRVIYTRKTDVFIGLERRTEIANENKADLFISVHTNSLPKGRIAYGTETYTLGMARANENLEVAKRENSVITYEANYKEVYQGFDPNRVESYIIFELLQDKNMAKSVELARCIEQQYVSTAGRRTKGVHQGGLLVLRHTSMPAVLTELGFISTPAEERFLNSDEGVRKMSRSLFNGFQAYRKKYDKNAKLLPKLSEDPVSEVNAVREEPQEKKVEVVKETTAEVKKVSQPKAQKVMQPTVSGNQRETPQSEQPKAKAQQRPVFKVQLLVADRPLKSNDRRLKGIKPVEYYKEKGMYKYTYGNTTDYNEIVRKHKSVKGKLPGTFIVAFMNGERMNLHEAIKMFKRK